MLCARLPARFASTIGPIQFRGSVEFQFTTNLSFMGLKHAQPCFSIAGNLRLEFVASQRLQFYMTISDQRVPEPDPLPDISFDT